MPQLTFFTDIQYKNTVHPNSIDDASVLSHIDLGQSPLAAFQMLNGSNTE